jgi:hypothetical protein
MSDPTAEAGAAPGEAEATDTSLAQSYGEESFADEDDAEVEAAAVKIQAAQRGKAGGLLRTTTRTQRTHTTCLQGGCSYLPTTR